MLHGNVLHQSTWRASITNSPEDVVGISWKPVSRSHPNASLVVTCDHQVIVYKPGEFRRVHQWSFKPSPTASFSNATVFLPSSARYVGVQRGSNVVSWRETDADIKEPLSTKANGIVQAVHGCPKLGDVFVAVLKTGTLCLYQGTLRSLARYDTATPVGGVEEHGGNGGKKLPAPCIVWSGVQGTSVFVLEEHGGVERIKTYAVSVPKSRVTRPKAKEGHGRIPDSLAKGHPSITLISTHSLAKPVGPDVTPGQETVHQEARVCSADFLGEEGSGDLSLAWRCSRGPFWTRVLLCPSGVREEMSRLPGMARSRPVVVPESPSDSIVENNSGQKPSQVRIGSCEGKRGVATEERGLVHGTGDDETGSMVSTVAAADGGRLLVHSGGASPRLALWDANYGVLLVEDEVPECSDGGLDARAGGDIAPRERGKGISMAVSGDGAYVALCAGRRVTACPLPSRDSGSLASLLRRKRPAVGALLPIDTESSSSLMMRMSFASVDLTRSSRAADLLARTGGFARGEWEDGIIAPFEEEESDTIRSLEEAAHRKDGVAFEHILVRAAGVEEGFHEGANLGGDAKEHEYRKRRRGASTSAIRTCSSRILNAAVVLCLANPEANLWNALSLLVKSGGVSARHHRGLVTGIIGHAPLSLLEQVMLHVPDLPEADAVRILRYFLLQAATMPEQMEVLSPGVQSTNCRHEKSFGVEPLLKRRVTDEARREAPVEGERRVESGGVVIGKTDTKVGRSPLRNCNKIGSIESAKRGAEGGTRKDSNPHKVTNGVVVNGKCHFRSDQSHMVDYSASNGSSGVADGEMTGQAVAKHILEQEVASRAVGGKKGRTLRRREKGGRGSAIEIISPAVRAERGVRVALTLPFNEAFLRSALEVLEIAEVVVFLKILTRILVGDGSAEGMSAAYKGSRSGPHDGVHATQGLSPARTEAVLGWLSAVIDAHFTQLALGGSFNAAVCSSLSALGRLATREIKNCELLSEVQSLMVELDRRRAATEESQRRSKRELYSIEELRF